MLWLASYPRSGNTFFRIVLSEVYGIESSEFPDPRPKGGDRDYLIRGLDCRPDCQRGKDPPNLPAAGAAGEPIALIR
jgi:hypothetical protein